MLLPRGFEGFGVGHSRKGVRRENECLQGNKTGKPAQTSEVRIELDIAREKI